MKEQKDKNNQKKIEAIEKELIDTIEQRQSFNEGDSLVLDGVQKIKKQLRNIDTEVKEYGYKEAKCKEKIDELKEKEKELNDTKSKLDSEYEKSMAEISKMDKNFSKQDKDEFEDEDFREDTEGVKLGNQDLNRVLNFYGDMDKPDNKRKIDNQKISKNQRDW